MTDQTAQSPSNPGPSGNFSRRSLFRAAGVGAAVVGGGAFLDACSSGLKGSSSSTTAASGGASSSGEITIGWIHPLTGSLAGFGAPDDFVTQQIMATSQYKNGIKIGNTTYKINIKSYDTQSSVTQAGTLAKQAIQADKVDLLFASSTPETVNAVASEAEHPGHPADLREHPVGVLLHQPGRQPAEADPEAEVLGHVLPRGRAPGRGVHPDVEPDRRQIRQRPHCRGHVPERLRRQRVPRGVPADRQGRRVHDRPVLPLHRRPDELLLDDLPVQVGEGATSSPTCRCRPTSRSCGSRPCSRASSRSWRRWPRCCCSRATPTRWAAW